MPACPYCEAQTNAEMTFCPRCGARLVSNTGTSCPKCGALARSDDLYCRKCGGDLGRSGPTHEPRQQSKPAAQPDSSAPPRKGPCLVITVTKAIIFVPVKNQVVIGREDPVTGAYPDIDLTPYGAEYHGISRLHARLLCKGGKMFVEDLESLNATFVNRQPLTPHVQQELNEGDEIQLGSLALIFHTQ